MAIQSELLKDRTKQFAIHVIRDLRSLPTNNETHVINRQLLRSATSVAANYRAVCRSRSKAEFVSKIGVVVEEADETVFWLEMLSDLGFLSSAKAVPLLKEANELLAIFAASQRTARANKQ
jgi:four helix bundle protein